MGLSGVGKTTLGRMLSSESWFHYSVDYRIFTHYLADEVNDYLKLLAMEHPILNELLKKDAITVEHRVHIDNLAATSPFMGMLGDPTKFGSAERDFRSRMAIHAAAEKAATLDVPKFKTRAKELYNYPNFLIDFSGSLCEVVEPDEPNDPILKMLKNDCTLVYIRASQEHKEELVRRAVAYPKPIYYRPDFLDANLPDLLKEFSAGSVDQLDPADVGAFLYPRLLDHRIKRYEAIAQKAGVTIELSEALDVKNEAELLDLISQKLA